VNFNRSFAPLNPSLPLVPAGAGSFCCLTGDSVMHGIRHHAAAAPRATGRPNSRLLRTACEAGLSSQIYLWSKELTVPNGFGCPSHGHVLVSRSVQMPVQQLLVTEYSLAFLSPFQTRCSQHGMKYYQYENRCNSRRTPSTERYKCIFRLTFLMISLQIHFASIKV
jgi:hypothetical protein